MVSEHSKETKIHGNFMIIMVPTPAKKGMPGISLQIYRK
jgi:hypothetical protein